MKVELEVKIDRTEMNVIRWICGFILKETKKSVEVRELFGLDPLSLIIEKGRWSLEMVWTCGM